VPYKAVDSLIDDLSQHLARLPRLQAEGVMPRDVHALARLFPVLRQVEAVTAAPRRAFETPDPLELRRRAFQALRELLARLADRAPLVLCIDDLQWGDQDSAALLGALLRPPDAPSLLLVACHRAEESTDNPFLRDLRVEVERRAGDLREVTVGPLEAADARSLALALLEREGATERLQADRIAQEAGGSPFFIHELARHVREGERSAPEVISLDELLRARLRRLPDNAARLLGMVATAGRPILVDVAQRAAETLDPTALAVLKAGNLVRTRGGGDSTVIECYHDRIRETAVALHDDERLKRNHLRLAIALESSIDPDPEALSVHFRQAGEHARAAEFAVKAAERAEEALAFERAARLYRIAIELHPPDRAALHQLQVRLGDALANAGHGPDAAEAYLVATERATAAEALDLRRRAATQLLLSGHFKEGVSALRQVLQAVGMKLPATPAAAMASLLWRRARVRLRGYGFRERDRSQVQPDQLTRIDIADAATTGFGMVDSIRATAFQSQQLLLALDAGEPYRVARALASEAVMISLAGPSARRRAAHALAVLEQLAARLDLPELHATAIGVGGIIAFQTGEWRVALERCGAAEELFRDRCAGFVWEMTTTQIFTLFAQGLLGNMNALGRRLAVLLKEAEERGDLYSQTNLLAAVGYAPGLCADQPARSRAELAEALARWNVPEAVHVQHLNALASETLIDLYCGEGGRAYDRIVAAWRSFESALLFRVQTLRVNGLSARGRSAVAAARAGRPELLRVAEADARRLDREGVPYCTAIASSIRASAARVRGDTASALRILGDCERQFAVADMALHVAASRLARGQLLGGDEGAQLVSTAEAMFRKEGVLNPARFAATVIPDLGD
jgi:hypothetical protein